MGKHRYRKFNRGSRDIVNKAVAQIMQNQTSRPVSTEIATRARSIDFVSVLGNLPNPDPVLKKKNIAISAYEELAYDSRVQACISSRKAPPKAMEYLVMGDDVPQNIIQFYKDIFDSWNMTDIISEICDAWMYGYKPIEILWTFMDGKILPHEFVGKPPGWFKYDKDNNLRFLTSANIISGELVPKNKFVVARNNATYENPYGTPVLSSCFWPVIFRRTGLKFFTQFIEKYGSPFLLAHAEEGAQEERINEMAELLSDMVQDAIAVVPKGWDIKLLEAGEGKGKADSIHQNYLDVMNNEIQLAILGTNLTTEVGPSGGSYAASQSHMEVRDDIIEGDTRIIEQTFNELISYIHELNFLGQPMPYLKLFREEAVDELRSKRDLNLTKAGVRFKKNYYQRAYSLGEDEFEVTEPQQQASPF